MSEINSGEPRTKGRPPSIDRVAALDAAVLTFWEKGYDGTSLTDLTDAMKLSRPSLYSAFGDKAKLFDAALLRYAQTIGSAAMVAFQAEPHIERAVRTFLRISAEGNTARGLPSGCLIGCCAPAAAESDSDVRQRLDGLLSATESHLAQRFAAEPGLPSVPVPMARAAMMLDFLNAQAIRARAGASRADLMEGLNTRVQAVLGDQS
jgi:AcrR family transcriptional regulator